MPDEIDLLRWFRADQPRLIMPASGQAGMSPDEPGVAGSEEPLRDGKYARVERERRFLLAGPPPAAVATAPRQITDRYLAGTRLRLRRVEYPGGGLSEFKLTQKVPAGRPGPVRGLITNIYLSPPEYDLFAMLPAAVLSKTRVSVPPVSIDIFGPPRHGLVLAEAEFATDHEAARFRPPPGSIAEVTDDARFTGGRLARAGRDELLAWLAEYGLSPGAARHGWPAAPDHETGCEDPPDRGRL